LLQESSILEENVTLREIPMWGRFSQQWLWRLLWVVTSCSLVEVYGLLHLLSSGQLCAFGSIMLESFFLLFPFGFSVCGYTGNITLYLGLEWTKLDYDGWTMGVVWKMHHYCWVQCTIISWIWFDVWWKEHSAL
jgi:hypothetical protein